MRNGTVLLETSTYGNIRPMPVTPGSQFFLFKSQTPDITIYLSSRSKAKLQPFKYSLLRTKPKWLA